MTVLCRLFFVGSLLSITCPAWCVREGGDNGSILAERFEEKGEWMKAALWREAVATTLQYVSKPLAEDQIKRVRANKDSREVQALRNDLGQIEELIVSSHRRAAANRAKAKRGEEGVELEKKRIARFLDLWIPYYPRALSFSWGYDKMRRKADRLTKRGDVKGAMGVQEDHWQKCADWYQVCCLTYYQTRDKKKATHFEGVVSLLRQKAGLYRKKKTNPELSVQRELAAIDDKLKVEQSPPHKLTLSRAMEAARKALRLSRFKSARLSGWYQGAYWLVLVKQNGREVARVTVDDHTGEVLDVKLSK